MFILQQVRKMRNVSKLFYVMLFIFIILLYGYYEYDMYNAKAGSGLGVYLIYLVTLFVHSILLITIYRVRKFRKLVEGKILFRVNFSLVIFLLSRLLVFIWIT